MRNFTKKMNELLAKKKALREEIDVFVKEYIGRQILHLEDDWSIKSGTIIELHVDADGLGDFYIYTNTHKDCKEGFEGSYRSGPWWSREQYLEDTKIYHSYTGWMFK